MVNCKRTVCACGDRDDNGQRPVEDESEENKRDDNVDKCGNDIEQDKLRIRSLAASYRGYQGAYLKGAVDSCTSVQNPQYLSSLTTHMERQRKIQEVVESELRHSWCGKSGGGWIRNKIDTYHDQNIASPVPKVSGGKLRLGSCWRVQGL